MRFAGIFVRTHEEFEVIKQLPLMGCEICSPLRSLAQAMPCIRWHHELPNGRGYPDRLQGDAIPQLARIMAVADVFDAAVQRSTRTKRRDRNPIEVG